MINITAITEWRTIVPWSKNEQVEQDLIICRALVAIFSFQFFNLIRGRSPENIAL